MFDKKQIVRNVIFGVFCVLILMIALTLTYYVTFYDEEKAGEAIRKMQLVKETEPQITSPEEKCQMESYLSVNAFSPSYFVNSLFFKLSVAFFAGCLASDGFYIKMGVI